MSKCKNPYWIFLLISSLALALALGSLFLPFLMVATPGGESVFIFGHSVLFGGQVEARLASGTYAFTFELNIYLLIAGQGLLLALVACLLGKESSFNQIFSIILGLASIILLSLMFVVLPSSFHMPLEGIYYGVGFYLAFSFGIIGVSIEAFFFAYRLALKK
ncbi:MAG: hypothetical protein J6328_04295, partial [Bacilli bacterium]|nr:hypothetical protein [Bacilli bacterium]